MPRNFAVTGVAVLLGLTLACTSKSSTPLTPTTPGTGTPGTAADGSTMKVTAPVPQSPVNDVKPALGPAKLVVAGSTGEFIPVLVSYRYQVFNAANVMVENSVSSGTSHEVNADLLVNNRYTWRARAEAGNDFGPWSTTASFTAPESAFLRGSEFRDPLTSGKTVGVQHGGHFIQGQGWKADTENDGIDYDLTSPCDACVLEFDTTGFGKAEGEPIAKDLKWITMGDASTFGDFTAFRNHPWKMHVEQRSDGGGTGMKLVWRNGDVGGGEPGDHDTKFFDGPNWQNDQVFHFRLEWDGGGYGVFVNGDEQFGGGWSQAYAPNPMRVSLGCWPRSETMWAVYRNVRLSRK